ncbi:MAG: hypothetical protein P4M00_25450 [Azospirillaceae bacterium]|nr:hypothetical protein [Azospirillaceae bacterium]
MLPDPAAPADQRLETLAQQIAALQQTVTDQDLRLKSWGARGAGRRTVLNVHEKPASAGLAKAEGLKPEELLAKALDAQKAGRLRGHDVVLLEAYLGRGQEPPAALLTRVLG